MLEGKLGRLMELCGNPNSTRNKHAPNRVWSDIETELEMTETRKPQGGLVPSLLVTSRAVVLNDLMNLSLLGSH